MTILYLYATIFAIYFILYAISSSGYVRKLDKYTQRDANICVVVYASGNVNTLENLLLQLKNQNYPKHNYTIYAILDKCENISDVTLQSDLNINVVNINNFPPFFINSTTLRAGVCSVGVNELITSSFSK